MSKWDFEPLKWTSPSFRLPFQTPSPAKQKGFAPRKTTLRCLVREFILQATSRKAKGRPKNATNPLAREIKRDLRFLLFHKAAPEILGTTRPRMLRAPGVARCELLPPACGRRRCGPGDPRLRTRGALRFGSCCGSR